MKCSLHIITFIILNLSADCGARFHVVYMSTGEKAHLTLKEHKDIRLLRWRKDHVLIATLENQKSFMRHPEKYHIHVPDGSLFIQNLTVNDSGYYKAQTGPWDEETIHYNLTVQEAVSEPVISVSIDQQSKSSSSCHMLVKCSADEESVIYNCDHRHCTRTNLTSSRVQFSINYTVNDVLECTASNRVSTKRTSISTTSKCSLKPAVPVKAMNKVLISIICCTMTLGVVMICVIRCFYNTLKNKQNKGSYEAENLSNLYSMVMSLTPETLKDCSAGENTTTTVYYSPSNM